ncbi:MAG: CPBP family intramembrane metalloprotease domain-containing protein [Thaumarchaeota archaeon]|nr:CPBP family intramembrane metalloprotease [Nitrosopumilus sp.]PHY04518.1 MAG: CPBP family intramembrane metalloprotease domain-containing protein [Nitrososphaerota archaeon]
MKNQTKILQFFGIPFTALLSIIFGLLLISFPIGIYVVFQTDIGDEINYDYPITHLDIFQETNFYQSSFDLSIGDVFVLLWIFYLAIFVFSILGPKQNFLKSISSLISMGQYDVKVNYMFAITKWLSILVLISALINFFQEYFGIITVPPLGDNNLIQFFYVSLAPLLEEFIFRIILVGIPLFALYSSRASFRYFLKCLWTPSSLNILDSKKAIFVIVFVGIAFGFAHIAFGDSWSEGKFAQATAGGIILGWVYFRYGFVVSLLIHWATNYFIFAYAHFISQINYVPLETAFINPLMSSLELLFLSSGILGVCIIFLNKFYLKKSLI